MEEHLDMSYAGALLAAGATLHAFEEFGSYQGDWWAQVTFNGETGWVHGFYGSCSGCDSLQGEFGYDFGEAQVWDRKTGEYRDKTDAEKADERQRFADFGRSYLEDMILTQEEAVAEASRNLEWDSDAREVLRFLQEHAGD